VPDVLVTGAASGIGAAVAALLEAQGTTVTGLDLQGTDIACDLSDAEAIDAVVRDLGPLDGLVNCAGIPGTHPPARILAVNLLAPRRLAAGLDVRGAVVDVASVAALRSQRTAEDVAHVLATDDAGAQAWLAEAGLDGTATYDFTKQALVALSLHRAKTWLSRGVRSVSVSPGPTATPILTDFEQTMGADRMAAAAALVGRHGEPADIAPLIAFLLSDGARWINGVDVRADGGVIATRLAPTLN
jgi:NAD(P)-dependent dehydrogenase (short-subunit alcohol dehydrogenase family)